MKRVLCGLVIGILGLFIGVTSVLATTYIIDYNENAYQASVTDTFTIDDFVGIDSATLYLTIKGRRQYCNSRGYCWYYDSDVNIDAGSTASHHMVLAGSFEIIELVLNQDTINSMLADDNLGFSIQGLSAYWWSDQGGQGYTNSRFYLDNVILDVTPSSSVPIPGAIWLLGSGVLGLIGIRRKKM
jgi:hypothetical protein